MKKKISKLLFVFLCCFICNSYVYAESAEDYIDYNLNASDYSITVNAETGDAGSELDLTLNFSETDAYSHYVIFVKDKSSPRPNLSTYIKGPDYKSKPGADFTVGGLNQVDIKNEIEIINEWYLLQGYEYAYIIKTTKKDNYNYNYSMTSEPIHVKKPELPSLTERYKIFVFDTSNVDIERSVSVFPYYPCVNTFSSFSTQLGSSKAKLKVGVVNDQTVLNKIRTGASDGYASLVNYAKGAQGEEYDLDLSSSNSKFDLKNLKVINGSYYYLYVSVEEPLYRNLDGISLKMGKNNMIVNDLEWSDTADVDTKKPVSNPKTGGMALGLIFFVIVLAGCIGMYVFNNKKINNI